MIKIGIVGASGYTGAELVRLLAGHPQAKITAVTSETFSGQSLAAIYPALGGVGKLLLTPLAETDLSRAGVDVVFLGLPHGESQHLTPGLLAGGVKVIDLSGDFRFQDVAVYEAWYKRTHAAPDLAGQAVYGLPEFFRQEIRPATCVANPGCYVTAAALALYPLLKNRVVDAQTLIVDAKSGVSGAGRQAKADTHFNRVSENVIPYKLAGTHQHTPEMEMALARATGQEVRITFTPQLVPAKRGILAMAYGRLLGKTPAADIQRMFEEAYSQETFVRALPASSPWPDLSDAVGSNCCVVKAAVDQRTGLVLAAAVLDNLIKGAAGQAIQNMNLLFGLEEDMGLPQAGLIP